MNETRKIEQYIVYLLLATPVAMPLYTFAGDACIWVAAFLGLYDWISQRGRATRPWPSFSYFALGFCLWSLLSEIQSPQPLVGFGSWFYHMGTYSLAYVLTARYLGTPNLWRTYMKALFATALLVCFIGFYQYIFVHSQSINIWVDNEVFPGIQRRMYSTLQNPNLLGAYLLMIVALFLSTVLFHLRSGKGEETLAYFGLGMRHWWLCLPWLCIFLIAMALTYSRGIWISLLALIVAWGFFMDKRYWIILLAVPIFLILYHGGVSTRMLSLFSDHDTSVSLRWALWDSTTYMIKEHPIMGIGWDNYWLVYPHYNYFIQGGKVLIYHAHNLFLNVTAETGFVGAILYFGAMYGHGWKAWRMPKGWGLGFFHYGVPVLLVGLSVSGLTDHDLFSHQLSALYWQILGLIVAANLHFHERKMS